MRVSKETWDKMKKRGKGVARGAVSGSKSTVIEGGAGAVVAYAADMLDKNFTSIAKYPWAKGAIAVAGGHFLKRKKSMANVGAAICGAGGLLLGQYFKNEPKAAAATTPATATAPAAAPAAAPAVTTQTGGFGDDTGRVVRFPTPDTGFVVRSSARDVAV